MKLEPGAMTPLEQFVVTTQDGMLLRRIDDYEQGPYFEWVSPIFRAIPVHLEEIFLFGRTELILWLKQAGQEEKNIPTITGRSGVKRPELQTLQIFQVYTSYSVMHVPEAGRLAAMVAAGSRITTGDRNLLNVSGPLDMKEVLPEDTEVSGVFVPKATLKRWAEEIQNGDHSARFEINEMLTGDRNAN